MKKTFYRPVILSLSCLACTTVYADIGFGAGVTYVFGGQGAGLAVGPKVFSKDREEKVVASAGVDYVINSSSFRPNLGVAYLFEENAYADVNIGYNLKFKTIDYAVSGGYAKTDRAPSPSSDNTPPPSPPPP